MEKRYRFSVVIPIYNKADVLDRAINSVLNQTFTDYEIILINDGSIDNSESICLKYAQNENISYIKQENKGVSVARNQGIINSRATLITFLDPDDEWYSDHLEILNRVFEENHERLCLYSTCYDIRVFDGTIVDVKKETYSKIFKDNPSAEWLLFDNPFAIGNTFKYPYIHTNSIMIPRQIFHKCGLFTVGCKRSQDTDMWYRVGLKYPFVLINSTTTLYHREDSTETKKTKMNYAWPFLKTADDFIDTNPDSFLLDGLINFIDNTRISMSRHLFMEGRRQEANQMLSMIKMPKRVWSRYLSTKLIMVLPYGFINAVYRFKNRNYFGR